MPNEKENEFDYVEDKNNIVKVKWNEGSVDQQLGIRLYGNKVIGFPKLSKIEPTGYIRIGDKYIGKDNEEDG